MCSATKLFMGSIIEREGESAVVYGYAIGLSSITSFS